VNPLDPGSGAGTAPVISDYGPAAGDRAEAIDRVLRRSPAFGQAHLRMTGNALSEGALRRKTRELVLLAANLMRSALELGATAADLLSVLKLVTSIGFEAATVGYELLAGLGPAQDPASA